MYLVDINILLALTFESHEHHKVTLQWFNDITEGSCALCRFTQQGYLRLICNTKIFGKEAVSIEKAWELYGMLLKDRRIFFLAVEPENIDQIWEEFTLLGKHSYKVWSDAYLAAFAKGKGFTFVTFDRDFIKFTSQLEVKLLTK